MPVFGLDPLAIELDRPLYVLLNADTHLVAEPEVGHGLLVVGLDPLAIELDRPLYVLLNADTLPVAEPEGGHGLPVVIVYGPSECCYDPGRDGGFGTVKRHK